MSFAIKNKKKLIAGLATLVAAMTFNSCSDSEFAGSGDKKSAEYTSTPSSDPQTGYPTDPNTGVPIAPGTTPTTPGGGDKDFDIWNWFGWGNNGLGITFGSLTQSWRIGDDQAKDTSCKLFVEGKRLAGTTYHFSFHVNQNNTQVGIVVKHCGVDSELGYTNTAVLSGPNGTLGTMTLVSNNEYLSESQAWPQTVTLNQGWHKISISSPVNTARDGDRDDFVIRKIEIAPSAPVQLGDVTAN